MILYGSDTDYYIVILGTKKLVCDMRWVENPDCRLCNNHEETIKHLFFECEKTCALINSVKNWIKTKINVEIKLSSSTVLFCYLLRDQNHIPINTILLVMKYYIFACAQGSRSPNIIELQTRLRNVYLEQKSLSRINMTNDFFTKTWQRFMLLFLWNVACRLKT